MTLNIANDKKATIVFVSNLLLPSSERTKRNEGEMRYASYQMFYFY